MQEVEEGVLEAVEAQDAAGCYQSLLEGVICEQELVENCLHHQSHCHHQNLLPLFHQVLCLRKSKIDRLSGGAREHSLIKLSRV